MSFGITIIFVQCILVTLTNANLENNKISETQGETYKWIDWINDMSTRIDKVAVSWDSTVNSLEKQKLFNKRYSQVFNLASKADVVCDNKKTIKLLKQVENKYIQTVCPISDLIDMKKLYLKVEANYLKEKLQRDVNIMAVTFEQCVNLEPQLCPDTKKIQDYLESLVTKFENDYKNYYDGFDRSYIKCINFKSLHKKLDLIEELAKDC